jgi:hypothetical protein
MKTYTVRYNFPEWFERKTAVIAADEGKAISKALQMVPSHVRIVKVESRSFQRHEGHWMEVRP